VKRVLEMFRAYIKLSQQQSFSSTPCSESLPPLHLAISGALSGSETVQSASFTSFFKIIADMPDLLKQMWLLLTPCGFV
jgi:hypothetical protein